jgi:hypothetical protein
VVTCIFEPNDRLQTDICGQSQRVWSSPDGTAWLCFYKTPAGYLLRFPNLADFEISDDGLRARCWPALNVPILTCEHLFLNQVSALALSRQGKLVLHASAVDIHSSGVAFIGRSGAGKSTLAASFATSGLRFLTDDGLLLEQIAGETHILPSHPSIRLWRDSEAALVTEQLSVAPQVSFTTKARFLAGDHALFCNQSRALKRVYFLGEPNASAPSFERMRPVDVLLQLIKHSFILDTETRSIISAHFEALNDLAKLPIFFRLDYPRRYEDLPAVRQAIIKHLHSEQN